MTEVDAAMVSSSVTARLYASALNKFFAWCQIAEGDPLPTIDRIIAYLKFIQTTSGPSSVPVHLSAIASFYRKQGMFFDTRQQPLQKLMRAVRSEMKQKDRLTSAQRTEIMAAFKRELTAWGLKRVGEKAEILFNIVQNVPD